MTRPKLLALIATRALLQSLALSPVTLFAAVSPLEKMPEGQGMAGLPTLHPNAEHRACAHVELQTLLDNNAVSEKSG